MYGFGGHGWGMGFGWLFGIIVLFIWIISKTISHAYPSDPKSALDILKERYARGEISNGEFEEKKHQIS